MKIAVFWGCKILTSQYAYEMSIRETFPKLDAEVVDLKENHCCGDPVKSVKDSAAGYLAARVLALANATGLDHLLVPCNRCHFMLSETMKTMQKDSKFRLKITNALKEEGLSYSPKIRIWHVIDFLHDLIGLERVQKAVRNPLKGLRLATHIGCQIIRYSDLGRVDKAEKPQKMDKLVNVLEAETVEYPKKLECCGGDLIRSHREAALSLAGDKLNEIQGLSIDGVVVSCPECNVMFDSNQNEAAKIIGAKLNVPVVYYTQLLGLAMGIEKKKLGLHLNKSSVDQLLIKIIN